MGGPVFAAGTSVYRSPQRFSREYFAEIISLFGQNLDLEKPVS
jgi:hypothetical protein